VALTTPHGPLSADPARTRPEVPAPAASPPPDGPPPRRRLRSIDVARGLAVVGMLFVDNRGSGSITRQLVHVPWNGLHVADIVFPVFLLVVGVSMPFSSRANRPRAVLWRVAKLFALGCLIVTAKYGWGGLAPGVLGHIAGAYLLCWLLLRLPKRAQVPLAATALAAMGALYLFVPVPGAGRAAMEPDVSWASWFDGLIPLGNGAEAPHAYLPSAITVFLGVLAGRVLRAHGGPAAVPRLLLGGTGLLAVGGALAFVLPLNKHLWSPSYVLLTGGIGLVVLAVLHWLVDLRGTARPFRFAEVLGTNAIVAFAASELVFRAVLGDVQPRVVEWLAGVTGDVAAAYLYPAFSVLVLWAACWALLRRQIVVRI
jgi:predicted acyltransferase